MRGVRRKVHAYFEKLVVRRSERLDGEISVKGRKTRNTIQSSALLPLPPPLVLKNETPNSRDISHLPLPNQLPTHSSNPRNSTKPHDPQPPVLFLVQLPLSKLRVDLVRQQTVDENGDLKVRVLDEESESEG